MSKFPNHDILKLFQKLRENFFQNFLSQNWLLYEWLFSWHLLEISDYTVVPKNISKIIGKISSKSPVPHGSFKFPQNFRKYNNFLRILEYIQISSKLLNPFF